MSAVAEAAPETTSVSAPPLRLALVVHTFDMGGIERNVARLVNGLDRARFAPLVICLNRSGTATRWLTVADAPIVELHKRSGNDLGLMRRLARVLREREVSIVHSHNWGTLLETVLARRWARTPIHVHAERGTLMGGVSMTGWQRRLRVPAARWAMRSATRLMTNAASIAERLESVLGLDRREIEIISNGVDLPGGPPGHDARSRNRALLDIPSDAVVVGSVGRLVDVKDFRMLIDAFSQAAGECPRAHLLLVGDGPLRTQLGEQAVTLGMAKRVHFAGQQEHVADWLAAMDVYVNSSKSEGMSQSVVEAMAAGLPLVVTDVGDSGLLAGQGGEACGVVVAKQDPLAMAAGLRRLLDDEPLRGEFAQRAAQRHARDYSVETMLGRYERMYTRLAAAQGLAVAAGADR